MFFVRECDKEGLLCGVQNRLREAKKGDEDLDSDFFFEGVVNLLSGNADNQSLFDVLSFVYLVLELRHKMLSRILPEDKYFEVCGREASPEQIAEIVDDIKASMADCHPYCDHVGHCLLGQVDKAYLAMGEEERKDFLQLFAGMEAEIEKLSRALPVISIVVVRKKSANFDPAPAGEEQGS